jgi:hypothetical protein
MNTREIIRRRLFNQQLNNTSFKAPSELVKWLGAVQSQDYNGAKWALANRLMDPEESIIEKALDEGSILRTHVLRPTWHFVSPEDIRWMIQLSEPRISALSAKYFRDLELDKRVLNRSNKVIAKALSEGKHLTRKELGEVLEAAGIATNDLRLTHIVFRAELDQLICSGAKRGKQFTYALLDQRAPYATILERDEALAELSRRYFRSRGPATVHDFTWWSGLSVADAKKGTEIIQSELDHDDLNNDKYFFSPVSFVPDGNAKVYLLPAWDEYTVAYKDRSIVIETGHEKEAGHGIFNPNIVINGVIKGSWRRALTGKKIVLVANYFSPISKTFERKVQAEAKRYADFFGLNLEFKSNP